MLESNLVKIMNWFDSNHIKVNVHKTQLMCYRNPLKATQINLPFTLHSSNCSESNCASLEYVNSKKYLGIYFNCDLFWNIHMFYLSGRLRSVSCLLHSLKVFLLFPIRKTLIHSSACSILRYGITIFGCCSSLWKKEIDAILKNTIKMLLITKSFLQAKTYFVTWSFPALNPCFFRTVALRHCWASPFKMPRFSERFLRTSETYVAPWAFTNYGKRMTSFYVPRIFNDIPKYIL